LALKKMKSPYLNRISKKVPYLSLNTLCKIFDEEVFY